MRKLIVVAVLAAWCAACGVDTNEIPAGGDFVKSSLERNMDPSQEGVAALTAGNRDFGFDLYHRLAAGNPGANVFLSPHSVSIALAMTYAGAKGDTATQMKDVLAFSQEDAATHEAFNALDLALAQRGNETVDEKYGLPFELSVVNAAWGQTGYPFLDGYLDVLALNYGAGMRLLDFMADPDACRTTINDWVANESHDRILDLLPAGSISSATALVLTNVIYFKANWLDKFDPEKTVDATFTKVDGGTVAVKMMKKSGELMHGTGDGYEYLEVPYVGRNVAMMLILPDAGKFDAVEAALDGASFAGMIAGSRNAMGKLGLPKFSFEFNASLNDPLKALGMIDIFDSDKADLSGMDGVVGSLYVSLVIHKSFVAVDEEGTEAAAATAVVVDNTSVPEDTYDMTFDRPFIFAIVDKPTGAVLFLGRVMDPSAE
jgi:serpin B